MAEEMRSPGRKGKAFDWVMTGESRGYTHNSFSQSIEGVMFLAGCILLAAELGILFALSHDIPTLKEKIVAIIVADLVGGRGASVSLGLDLELRRFTVILVSVSFNLTLLFIFYPLIIYFYEKLVEIRFVGKAFRSARKMAEKNQEKVEKWGALGIAFFVWVPFHSTGVLVGAIIGRLIGMRTITVIVTVILAMAASAVSWAYTFDYLFDVAEKAGKILPSVFVVFILAVVVFVHLWRLVKKRNRKL